ncbi:MAG: tetratricopeptide repeat protein [Desulfobacteraceae bacterium]|jgi:tetratricopeptide (TPR) repeat protein
MKFFPYKMVISIGVLCTLISCHAPQKTAIGFDSTESFKPMANNIEFNQPENGYYYFTEAQLKINSGNYEQAALLTQKAIETDSQSTYLKLFLANIYLQMRDSTRALEVIENLLAIDPDDIEALIIYAKIQHANKQLDAAAEGYEKVIALDPKQKNIYLLLGGIYLEQGKEDAALNVYSQLVHKFDRSYAGYFFIGKIYINKEQLDKAEEAFNRTLEIEPDLLEPRFELLEIYKSRGDHDRVLQAYQDILSDYPDNISASIGLSYFYYSLGKEAKASEIFADLGRRSLTETDIISILVQDYLDQKKYKALIVILKGMLKGAPENSNLAYILGVAYSGIDQSKNALQYFSQVDPESNFYENATVHTALIYQETGRLSEGIDFMKAAIDKNPENSKYYLYLGSFYEEMENYSQAIETINKGIAISPQDSKLYFRQGVIYDKWGKKNESIKSMKAVIRLDSKDANALNYLGYTYADLGIQLDEAERLVREALKYRPDDGYITDSLGWVFYKRGDFDKALPILKKAAKLVPEDPTILEHVGDTYLKLGDQKNALKYYQKSLKEQKDDTTAIRQKIDALTVQNP